MNFLKRIRIANKKEKYKKERCNHSKYKKFFLIEILISILLFIEIILLNNVSMFDYSIPDIVFLKNYLIFLQLAFVLFYAVKVYFIFMSNKQFFLKDELWIIIIFVALNIAVIFNSLFILVLIAIAVVMLNFIKTLLTLSFSTLFFINLANFLISSILLYDFYLIYFFN